MVVFFSRVLFFQSFFYHRYAAHGLCSMSKGWEKFLGWIYIILVPISILILAATAVPAYQDYVQRSQQMQIEQQQYYGQ